ncbi:MAG: hypothetical protein XD98_0180 [Microgenomates bacterium 39_6]|nr:MAG: hypothetical protein XD98_0180 [Microgenomates bacterium 39_6]
MKRKKTTILFIFLLFLTAFIEAVLLPLPITLIFVMILSFFWGEKIFPWAFFSGLWLDLLLWRHLGSWSLIFLTAAFLINFLKQRIFGLESGKLSLPEK